MRRRPISIQRIIRNLRVRSSLFCIVIEWRIGIVFEYIIYYYKNINISKFIIDNLFKADYNPTQCFWVCDSEVRVPTAYWKDVEGGVPLQEGLLHNSLSMVFPGMGTGYYLLFGSESDRGSSKKKRTREREVRVYEEAAQND